VKIMIRSRARHTPALGEPAIPPNETVQVNKLGGAIQATSPYVNSNLATTLSRLFFAPKRGTYAQ
jgi:hypothetical protein